MLALNGLTTWLRSTLLRAFIQKHSPSAEALSISAKMLGLEHPDTTTYREHMNMIVKKIELETG